MKKILYMLLCLSLIFSLFACGEMNNANEDVIESAEGIQNIYDGEISDPYGLTRWDQEMYAGEPYHPELEKFMGSVSGIYQDSTYTLFRVGKDIYRFVAGKLNKLCTVSKNNSDVYIVNSAYFDTLVIEETKNGKVNAYKEGGKHFFKGLELLEDERIIDHDASTVYVVSGTTGNYSVKAYAVQEDFSAALKYERRIGGYVLNKETSLMKDVISEYWSRGDNDVWELHTVADDRTLYTFSGVKPTSMGYQFCSCTEYSSITGVETVYGSKSGLGHYAPVYSKAGDTAAVYTLAQGESFLNTDDDRRIKINLPDGYSTEDIENIIGSKSSIIIEFNDGMIYAANSIDERNSGEYDCEILRDLSELNSENRIVAITATWTVMNRIYVLLDDGVIYFVDMPQK